MADGRHAGQSTWPASGNRWVLPSRDDRFVEAASEAIGGPVGRRALVGGTWWTPVRACLVLALVASAVGFALDQPCRSSGWTNSTTIYSHACYTDLVPLYSGRGLSQGVVPYFTDDLPPGVEPVEYPVVTGLAMWLTSLPVPKAWDLTAQGRLYEAVNAMAVVVLLLVTVWATAATARRRPWDAALVALAPGVVLTATLNWDMWAVALTSLAVLLWSRRYPFGAGLLLGLGAAAKFYPLLLLGPLFVLCLRAGRLRAFGLLLSGTVVSWAAVNLPVLLSHPDGWWRFYTLSRERGADFGSLWLVLSNSGVNLADVGRLNELASLLLALLCLGIGALALLAPRRPRFAQLAFLVLAAFVLTNKVYSPQYVLWLIPFAALARPRWRDFLLWQAAEAVYFIAVWWYILGFTNPDRALPPGMYDIAVLVHLLATAAYAMVIVRDAWRPQHDPVRAVDGDDPAGGVLEDAPDRFVLAR